MSTVKWWKVAPAEFWIAVARIPYGAALFVLCMRLSQTFSSNALLVAAIVFLIGMPLFVIEARRIWREEITPQLKEDK